MIGVTFTGRLTGARLVLEDRVMSGSVAVENGMITEIGAEDAPGLDLGGAFLMPGMIDLHTDHVEKHLFPRAGVLWNTQAAVFAHDAQIAAAGITTVFDSLSVGATWKNPERREALGPLLDTLEQARADGVLRADHLVHLRCEISDPATKTLVDANIGREIVRLVSVMDHTPGDRQNPDIARWQERMAKAMNVGLDEAVRRTEELLERAHRHSAEVRHHAIAAARGRALPVMSHDDAREEHVVQAKAEGVTVSEFPTTAGAARAARARGMPVVVGAPNYLRGGSQSGNVSVAALLAEGLVDVLASDYVPRSLIDAAFAIAADPEMPYTLPQTVAMVTSGAARIAGLEDRGRIAPGLRADLVVAVPHPAGCAEVRGVWCGGNRVL